MSGADRGPVQERFWAGVLQGEGCWEWQRYCCPQTGYGRLLDSNGKKTGAHRISWELHFGNIPEGLFVCHTCDNRKCVRPDHLFLGTPKDNVLDMRSKGRGSDPPRGPQGRSLAERRKANARRMSEARTHCKRGHHLGDYEPGRARRCMQQECADARKRK